VPSSLAVIKMRDGSASVGLSRETTSGFQGSQSEQSRQTKFCLGADS
jgi:hypothetical protein